MFLHRYLFFINIITSALYFSNTNILFINDVDSAKIVDIVDFIFSHKDSGFTYLGFFSDPGTSVIDKINALVGSNVKACIIEKSEDILSIIPKNEE